MKYHFDEIIHRKNTNCVKYDFTEKFFGTNDILPMWVADMDFKTPDFILEAVRERTKHPILGYTFFSDAYFQSIINWLLLQHQWTVKKEWISFSPGVVPGLSIIIDAFTNKGDKIIIQPPVYHPFYSIIEDNGREILKNPLVLKDNIFSMDIIDLELQIAKGAKMILLSNPHNPGGTIWKRKELEQLANLCLKNKVIIVSDEIHADLIIPGNKHIPVASISKEIENITITCMAPSKTFNLAGLSTSFILIKNPELMKIYADALNKMHIWFGNIFGSIALETAFNKGSDWLNQLMNYVNDNLQFLLQFFSEKIPNIKVMIPNATYMVWLDCRALKLSDEELKDFFIKKAKIGLNAGVSFGIEGSGFMRMNIACPRKILEQALPQIEDALKLL